MPAQTPDTGSRFDNVNGSLRQVTARFATVTANDTWATGLSPIVNAQATSGGTAATVTISGGTLTFTSTSTNVEVSALGY
jgi:hypothetical protein